MVFDLRGIDGVNGFRLGGLGEAAQAGRSVSGIGDINGDGIADFAIGAPNVQDSSGAFTILTGRSMVIFGSDSGFPSMLDLSTLDGTNGFYLNTALSGRNGFSISEAGDFNNDGIDDFMVGSPTATSNGNRGFGGETHVIFGSNSGFGTSIDLDNFSASQGVVIGGRQIGDQSGYSVSNAGDFNGDGIDDVIIGSPFDEYNLDGADPFIYTAGGSFVVYGSATPDATIDLLDLPTADGLQIYGTDFNETAGLSVSAAGDLNNDGIDDVYVGTGLGEDDSRGYVIYGAASGLPSKLFLSDINGANGFVINGVTASDQMGHSFDSLGDINGDGIDDVIIGAPNVDNGDSSDPSGNSYVIFGKSGGFGASFDVGTLNGSNGFRIIGEDGGDRSGVSVASAGDVNGDGVLDLLIGAEDIDKPGGADVGAAYVVFGKTGGYSATIDLGSLNASTGLKILGDSFSAEDAGLSISAAGDVNDDGIDDLIVGTPGGGEGNAYVIYGDTNLGALSSKTYSGLSSDFDGNDIDDILFFNGNTRTVGQFEMPTASWAGVGSAGVGWAARGTGLMDGDDDSFDILWFNSSTGNVGRFDMVDGVRDSWSGMSLAGAGWDVRGLGDFNGDGISDILWFRPDNGAIGQFRVNENGQSTWAGVGATGAGWDLVEIGSFNADNTDDLLFYNSGTGALGQYRMSENGKEWIGVTTMQSGFEVASTGDFNGDGYDDILLFNASTREVAQYNMANGTPTFQSIDTLGTGWGIEGTGDFNADGRDDILLRKDTGTVGQWIMDGTNYTYDQIGWATPEWDIVL